MKKLTAAAGPGAALIAGSLEGAGTAFADELSYLQAINEAGVAGYDAATAVNVGFLIYADLRLGSSYNQEAWSLVRGANGSLGQGKFTLSNGVTQVRVAHNELCPDVYAYNT